MSEGAGDDEEAEVSPEVSVADGFAASSGEAGAVAVDCSAIVGAGLGGAGGAEGAPRTTSLGRIDQS
ncbi:MAG: hypothetical protein WBB38_09185 [Hyphomicrobiaceae bacterium]